MDKYEKQKINIEQLPNDFSMSDKQTLTLIRDLFEMIKDGNKIIHLLDNRIKLFVSLVQWIFNLIWGEVV